MFKHPRVQLLLGIICGLALLAGLLWLVAQIAGNAYVMPTISIFFLLVAIAYLGVIAIWIKNSFRQLPDDPTSPVTLETFNDNIQASLLVAWLEEYGVNSTAVGGFVSGFQAESPGYVDVMVSQQDLEEARTLMTSWKKNLD